MVSGRCSLEKAVVEANEANEAYVSASNASICSYRDAKYCTKYYLS
jgi:hypothetical protein